MQQQRSVATTLRLRTPSYAHHSLAFSPYFDDRFALASGTNFGLVGNGRVHIVRISSQGLVIDNVSFDTQDSVYDVAWNEGHENQILAGCGNGAIKLFDRTLEGLPIKAWHEHAAEVVCVDWSNIEKHVFCTASWDGSCKVWSADRVTSISTLEIGAGQLFAAVFSPHRPALLCLSGQDGSVRLFDLRKPMPSAGNVASYSTVAFTASTDDILALDWNKYDQNVIATAGKDGAVRVWDLRNPSQPTAEMLGHTLAVRKVQWSPHHADILASAGYDMSSKVWSTRPPRLCASHFEHTEFTMAIGWALFDEGLLASAGWDQEVHLYRPLL